MTRLLINSRDSDELVIMTGVSTFLNPLVISDAEFYSQEVVVPKES